MLLLLAQGLAVSAVVIRLAIAARVHTLQLELVQAFLRVLGHCFSMNSLFNV